MLTIIRSLSEEVKRFQNLRWSVELVSLGLQHHTKLKGACYPLTQWPVTLPHETAAHLILAVNCADHVVNLNSVTFSQDPPELTHVGDTVSVELDELHIPAALWLLHLAHCIVLVDKLQDALTVRVISDGMVDIHEAAKTDRHVDRNGFDIVRLNCSCLLMLCI